MKRMIRSVIIVSLCILLVFVLGGCSALRLYVSEHLGQSVPGALADYISPESPLGEALDDILPPAEIPLDILGPAN